jgi:hypothetical protein
MLRQYLNAVAIALLAALTGCATITADRVQRFDQRGNEIVYLYKVDDSRIEGAKPDVNRVTDGLTFGSGVGTGSAIGAGPGMLGGALIGGVVSAIRDRGKLRFTYGDLAVAHEKSTGVMTFIKTDTRDPWDGWRELRPGGWVRISRDDKGVLLLPCEPECVPTRDRTGKIVPRDPRYPLEYADEPQAERAASSWKQSAMTPP